MSHTGVAPPTLRGLPNGFSNQQQLPQARTASSRLPNGKMGTKTPHTIGDIV
jgi:CCR4-NOT transcription complex subunit 2